MPVWVSMGSDWIECTAQAAATFKIPLGSTLPWSRQEVAGALFASILLVRNHPYDQQGSMLFMWGCCIPSQNSDTLFAVKVEGRMGTFSVTVAQSCRSQL